MTESDRESEGDSVRLGAVGVWYWEREKVGVEVVEAEEDGPVAEGVWLQVADHESVVSERLRLWVWVRLRDGVSDKDSVGRDAEAEPVRVRVGVTVRDGRERVIVPMEEGEGVQVQESVAVVLRARDCVAVRVQVTRHEADGEAVGDRDRAPEAVDEWEAVQEVKVSVGVPDGGEGVGDGLPEGVKAALRVRVAVRLKVGVRAHDRLRDRLSWAVLDRVRERDAEAVRRQDTESVRLRGAVTLGLVVVEGDALRLMLGVPVRVRLDGVRERVRRVRDEEMVEVAEAVSVVVREMRQVAEGVTDVGVTETEGEGDRVGDAVADVLRVATRDREVLGVELAVGVTERDRDVPVQDRVNVAVTVPGRVAEGVALALGLRVEDGGLPDGVPEAVGVPVPVRDHVHVREGPEAVGEHEAENEPEALRADDRDSVPVRVPVGVWGREAVVLQLREREAVKEPLREKVRVGTTEADGLPVRETEEVGLGVRLGLQGTVALRLGDRVTVSVWVDALEREPEKEGLDVCVGDADMDADRESVAVAEEEMLLVQVSEGEDVRGGERLWDADGEGVRERLGSVPVREKVVVGGKVRDGEAVRVPVLRREREGEGEKEGDCGLLCVADVEGDGDAVRVAEAVGLSESDTVERVGDEVKVRVTEPGVGVWLRVSVGEPLRVAGAVMVPVAVGGVRVTELGVGLLESLMDALQVVLRV